MCTRNHNFFNSFHIKNKSKKNTKKNLNEKGSQTNYIELLNSQAIVEDNDAISSIISILSNSDLYIRFYAAQLFNILIVNKKLEQIQTAVLSKPSGINLILDLVNDSRDPVRNGKFFFNVGQDVQFLKNFPSQNSRNLYILPNTNFFFLKNFFNLFFFFLFLIRGNSFVD